MAPLCRETTCHFLTFSGSITKRTETIHLLHIFLISWLIGRGEGGRGGRERRREGGEQGGEERGRLENECGKNRGLWLHGHFFSALP